MNALFDAYLPWLHWIPIVLTTLLVLFALWVGYSESRRS